VQYYILEKPSLFLHMAEQLRHYLWEQFPHFSCQKWNTRNLPNPSWNFSMFY